MKRTRIIQLVALLFICFCVSTVVPVIQFIQHDCMWWECAPKRNFRVLDLDIPSNLFPKGASISALHPLSEDFGPIEDGTKTIYWDNGNGIAVYNVFRYATIKKASQGFENNKDLLVNSETREAWKPSTELAFSSPTADTTYIACGYWSEKRCALVARYQEYVVFFNAVIDEKMTYSDFEKITIYLDEQISSRLHP